MKLLVFTDNAGIGGAIVCAVDSEAPYFQLRQLVADMPPLGDATNITGDTRLWLGRAATLVSAVLSSADAIGFRFASDGIGGIAGMVHDMNANKVVNIVYRALAQAELAAPAAVQGQFLSAGDTFSALTAVAKVFAKATADLMIVDKYADLILLSDFVVTAPEHVSVRILTGEGESRRAALTPAIRRWGRQYASIRPVETRFAPGPQLHDRLIVVDRDECWVVGQSFNGIAVKSPTYVAKLPADVAEQKIAAYTLVWGAALTLPLSSGSP